MAGFDAIVVGGGVVGLSAAYHLTLAGVGALLAARLPRVMPAAR